MGRCPDADTLGSLVAGTLPIAARADIAMHAASCSHCHAMISGLVDAPTHDGEPAEVIEILPGTLVGRYQVDGGLGVGGMGIVYAATDAELERRVALKLLRSHDASADASRLRDRLLREARTLARLSHPNVVTVFDVGMHAGQLFVAMELVDGGTLGAWLARAPRTLDDILARMTEAGRGLAAAHAAGVVHRDIKPDNILVGLDGRARVTDFGLARFDDVATDAPLASTAETLTRTGTLLGTPAYMAPEQLRRRTATPETDQWSFAATIYEAVAGVRPFAGDEPARESAIARGELVPPIGGRRVPSWLRTIITRALREDPAQRWPSVAALVEALARRGRRRRSIAIAGAVAVLGGVTVAVMAHRAPPAVAAAKTPDRIDLRPGCSCPYSACSDGCVSVCRASRFEVGDRVPGVNVPGRQEALVGASSDGATLLYLAGQRCALDHLFLARRRGDTFESLDLTPQLDARVALFEGCCTLSRDGQQVLLATAARRGFVVGTIAGERITLGDEVGPLAPSPRGTLRFPVLSDDALTVYYRFNEPGPAPTTEPDDTGAYDGTYSAHRETTSDPFSEPHRLGGRARHYEYPSGVSSDGLSLFFSSDFETHVMVRATTAQPFGDPAWTVPPARIQGWRAIPLAGCRQLVTTITPGGCESEDITYLDAIAE